jgi:8-oxo-dGTP pyrophosphatase MutT (NUDIX family)
VPPEERHPAGEHAGFVHLGDRQRLRAWRFSVVEAAFRAPGGELFHREVVRHPGAVAVVPVTERRSALLVRQYRGPIDRLLLEIPAGTRDVDGEPPERSAARELEEEVGVRARHLEHLATVFNSPGFCDEETRLYLATGLSPADSSRHGHEEQHIEVVEVPLGEVEALVDSGRLTDAQSIVGLLLARRRLGAEGASAPGPP